MCYLEIAEGDSPKARKGRGGQPLHPKGGMCNAYHDYVTYRQIHRNDYREKQRPPPGTVTV